MTYLKSLLAAACLLVAPHCEATGKTDTTYATVDRVMQGIPTSETGTTKEIAQYIHSKFAADRDKVRAAYVWTANNIAYDVEQMYAISYGNKQDEAEIKKALETHRGVCMHYALIFCQICQQAGIDAYVVPGYNKLNGSYAYLPHEWCAVRIDTGWYLVEPTWGAGYLNSEQHFVKKFTNDWFLKSPTAMLKTHMPFDPMWQLSHYPIKYDDFYDGKKTEDRTRPYFSYSDSIAAYERLDSLAQKEAVVRRMDNNGMKCDKAAMHAQTLKANVEIERKNREIKANNEQVDKYNTAADYYNKCIVHFNQFISYRNAQFKPVRPDAEIQNMMDVTAEDLKNAYVQLNSMKNPEENTARLAESLRTAMSELAGRVEEQQDFVKKYMSKGKLGRHSMFTKYTWMGIPLN